MNMMRVINDKIEKLKPIPQVAHQILAMAADPKTNASDLAEIIQVDAAITANLLRICNSAYFGLSVQVDSIQHAVNLLGMDQLVELVLVRHIAVQPNSVVGTGGQDDDRCWRHTVASALMARELAKAKACDDLPLLFTAALLRDIGRSVFRSINGDAAAALYRLTESEGHDDLSAERLVFGMDHTVLGEQITSAWNFSSKLTHIIRYHHDPFQGIHADRDAAIVYLADLIGRMAETPWDGRLTYTHHYPKALRSLNLHSRDLHRHLGEYRRHFHKADMLLQAI